jgi:hypothetical protein
VNSIDRPTQPKRRQILAHGSTGGSRAAAADEGQQPLGPWMADLSEELLFDEEQQEQGWASSSGSEQGDAEASAAAEGQGGVDIAGASAV